MPQYLTFHEDEALTRQAARVLAAIASGNLAEYRRAWAGYQTMAEARIESLPDDDNAHALAQIGLILAKADLWRRAGDRVRYWAELFDADRYAGGMAYELPAAYQIPSEPAIEHYLEREQGPGLSDRDRGLLNYRLAECYLALLAMNPDQPDVAALLDGSLQSALAYLEGEPEQAWALRLLEEIEITSG